MRKNCLAIALIVSVVLLPQVVAAQPSWDLLVQGGWSNASFWGGARDAGGQDGRNGFAGGVAAEFRSNENLGWEFGVWYMQKGSSGRISNELANSPSNPPRPPSDVVEGDFDLDYLGFSLLAALHQQVGDQWEVKGFVGPALNNLLRANFNGTVNGTAEEIDLKDNISNVDFVIVLGAGLAYEMEKLNVLLDVRAEFGTRNIDDTTADRDIRTRAVLVTLGVGIPLAH